MLDPVPIAAIPEELGYLTKRKKRTILRKLIIKEGKTSQKTAGEKN
jgi:hypothetical protein